jgi:hypothetical protein
MERAALSACERSRRRSCLARGVDDRGEKPDRKKEEGIEERGEPLQYRRSSPPLIFFAAHFFASCANIR